MTRRKHFVAALSLALVGTLAVVALKPWSEASRRSDPHPLALRGADLQRYLRATDAAATSTPRAELVAEGRKIFRSSALARDGESCQTCHTEGKAAPQLGTMTHPLSDGDFTGPRDPPSLIGVSRTPPFRWVGDVPSLRQMLVNTIVGHFTEGPSQPDATTGKQAAAMEAFLQTLEAPATDFDLGTLSDAAKRGEVLFQDKGGCIACHGGPLFTDNRLHNTLVPQAPGANDPGATAPPGAFNTPQLRDLVNSAPYMHNGSLKTLRDVVEFYNTNSSVAPLSLTPGEIDDLVAFLRAL